MKHLKLSNPHHKSCYFGNPTDPCSKTPHKSEEHNAKMGWSRFGWHGKTHTNWLVFHETAKNTWCLDTLVAAVEEGRA